MAAETVGGGGCGTSALASASPKRQELMRGHSMRNPTEELT